jgi:serine phosphatase RsbU (regulator of sigma subunit)
MSGLVRSDKDLKTAEPVGSPRYQTELSSGDANAGPAVDSEVSALRRDHAKLRQSVYEAAQIQRRLCAPRELTWNEFEVAGEIFPARDLSGDFFKVVDLGSSLVLALGDIAGKGLSAGIWQPHLVSLIERCAREHDNPADAVADMNRALCRQQGIAPLTCLFFAKLDGNSGQFTYCNAGLPAPILLRANTTLEQLGQGGPMLGVMENANFEFGRVAFEPGDFLVAYSDGVTECRNLQDEEFEADRLVSAARTVWGSNANKALFSLLATVLDFADTRAPGDDLSLLVLRRRDRVKYEASRTRKKDSATQRRSSSAPPPKRAPRRGPSTK